MSGGSGGTQAGGAAPTALLGAENNIFGNLGAGAGTAQQGALTGTQNLNTNPAANYGNAASVGQNLTTQGGNLAGQAMGAWQAGQDPQNALFAKQFQQQQDQSNANNAANGVAGTPYGAALTQQGNQNFDLNWQNQQLARENTAANTASTLLGSGASGATSGLSLGQSIDTQQANAQQNQIQDFLNYFLGNTTNSSAYAGAANQTYGDALSAAGLNNTAAQQSNAGTLGALSGLGSLAGSLGKLFLA